MPASNVSVVYGQGWGSDLQDLTLPSGAVCQIRKLQMEDISELGIIDQMDFLGQVVDEHHTGRVANTNKSSDRSAKKPTKAEQAAKADKSASSVIKDPAKFKVMIKMVDALVCTVVVQPVITPAYAVTDDHERPGEKLRVKIAHSDRVAGLIYSDSIGFQDKMAIFEFGFSGVRAMQSFRSEPAEDVGDVDDQPVTEDASE